MKLINLIDEIKLILKYPRVKNSTTHLTLAYIVELEEDVAESSNVNDIPTTIIRSKQDIAAGAASAASLSNSTNDIVINKLTQILSYLRAGKIFYVFCFTTLPRNELFCFKHISLFFLKVIETRRKRRTNMLVSTIPIWTK